MISDKINDDIKDVIERNVDAYKGYMKAADNVKSSQLKEAFRTEANQRRAFAAELESETHVLNKDINKALEDGSFEGSAHRTWMDIRTALSADKDETVVEECLRGERQSLEEYEELLKKDVISGNSHSLLRSQREQVRNSIIKLEQLEGMLD